MTVDISKTSLYPGAGPFYLLVSSASTFASARMYTGTSTAGGQIHFGQVDFADGEYFTVGRGAVTASAASVSGTQKVSLLQGWAQASDYLEASDYFGQSISSIGDLDGDGVDDLVVGAPYDDDVNGNAGAIYIMFMRTDGTVRIAQKISGSTG